jgi:hypothetical protein
MNKLDELKTRINNAERELAMIAEGLPRQSAAVTEAETACASARQEEVNKTRLRQEAEVKLRDARQALSDLNARQAQLQSDLLSWQHAFERALVE